QNAAGCTTSVNVDVAVAPGAPAAPTTVVTDPTCTLATGTIEVTNTAAGLTYSIDGGAFGPYPAGGYTGLTSGTHVIAVQNAAGCTTSVNVDVAVAPGAPALPTTLVTDPTCTLATGTIEVTNTAAGLTYSIDGGTFGPYPAGGYTGLTSGTHVIAVQNAAGCTTSVNVDVAVAPGAPALPTTTVTDPTCTTPDGTIVVTNTAAGLTYSIDGGPFGPYPAGGYTGLTSGTHVIAVQNAAGCTTSVNVDVAVAPGAPAAPTTTVTNPTCTVATGTIQVTNTAAGLTYSIDGGPFVPYPAGGYTGLTSGTHVIAVQNAAGCTTSVNVDVAVAPGAPAAPTTV